MVWSVFFCRNAHLYISIDDLQVVHVLFLGSRVGLGMGFSIPYNLSAFLPASQISLVNCHPMHMLVPLRTIAIARMVRSICRGKATEADGNQVADATSFLLLSHKLSPRLELSLTLLSIVSCRWTGWDDGTQNGQVWPG
jgi:hypothetical protein